jgi:hypothetical protein
MRRKSPTTTGKELLLFLSVLLLLAGCGRSAPVSYYQLVPVKGEKSPAAATAAGDLVIGIGPVRLQEHLDRPQLITRGGGNRLHLADRHRWAEPLAANIAWVLRDNLAVLLATEHILFYPWERATPINAQLSLDILHCEGMEDGTAQLSALWSLTDRNGKTLLPPQRSSYNVPIATPDAEGLAGALSEALARLSLDIAKHFSQLPPLHPSSETRQSQILHAPHHNSEQAS